MDRCARGTPELEPDGTIAAGGICGTTPDDDADRNVVRPGAGTWIVLDHRGRTVIQVSFDSSDAFTGHPGPEGRQHAEALDIHR